MNKDALLASIIGFGIGLVITAAVIAGPRILAQIKNFNSLRGDVASASIADKLETTSPTPATTDSSVTLTIDSPLNDAIVTESTLGVAGKASKNATIILGSQEDEVIIETKDTAGYQGKITLKEGKNDISVVQVLDGKSTMERRVVYYSPNN